MTARLALVPGDRITPETLDALPPVAHRYLDWAGVAGRAIPTTTALRQTGRLRVHNDKPWWPFTADEDFLTVPPGFSWRAQARLAGVPLVRAWDSYGHGRGCMEVRLGGLISLGSYCDGVVNKASLVRYLSELVWLPGAFLLANVKWEQVGEDTARVSITDSGLTVAGTLRFARDGRPLEFVGRRHRPLSHGRFSADPWLIRYTDYGQLRGVRVPTAAWAEYLLPTGPLRYIELRLQTREDGGQR